MSRSRAWPLARFVLMPCRVFFPTEGIGWSGSGIFLYGVSRMDGMTYGLAAALLISVVIAASWVPARRAMRVDPMVALRYE